MAPQDVARAVGMGLRAYLRTEESGRWRGAERRSAAPARVLGRALPDFVAATGREAGLAELPHSAVTSRRQAYVVPVRRLAPLDRGILEPVLQGPHLEPDRGHRHRHRLTGAGPDPGGKP